MDRRSFESRSDVGVITLEFAAVTVMSKVIRVESAEVLYNRVVVARIEDSSSWGWSLTDCIYYQPLSREAIERGTMQTLSELGRAFECRETRSRVFSKEGAHGRGNDAAK